MNSLLSGPYVYTIGDAPLEIPKIAPGAVQRDSCATNCVVELDNPSRHAWFIDNPGNPNIQISSSDISLVARQDEVPFSDIEWSTSSPGSCNESTNPVYWLKNPCQDLVAGSSTVIVDDKTFVDQTVDLNDPVSKVYSVGTFTDTISTS